MHFQSHLMASLGLIYDELPCEVRYLQAQLSQRLHHTKLQG